MKVLKTIWPWTSVAIIVLFIVRFFNDQVWLDVAFNLCVAFTVSVLAVEMIVAKQRDKGWLIGIIGIFVTILLIDVVVMVVT
ncbi:hypothetical protein JOC54_000041 [Alkalihalobacillus xiaoxiensis]|uniref:Uncharacterized protein n=1 Tax=Shouchella xiaoxiensis TaxID=766895 RepID=A0ABS2SNK6_9BACI|nr:hypothetical protein [Shouchella xiaoxiensis]MBM7836810.1 hypothetical protein [Shouchella xiaoxiensis]